MIENFEKTKKLQDFISGICGAMLLSSYTLCFCAVAGLNLSNALLCIIVCAMFSAKSENKIFSPDTFLLIPVFFIVSSGAGALLPLCVLGGTLICFILKKVLSGIAIPDCIIAGAGLGLALTATIILTNNYFGIGATGVTALEMLKSYRSLGFHPHFRGLLYGTITLFAMITYPFKFRKLNKYIPAEFITLLIPLVLNLFLNPDIELTTINEAAFEKISFNSIFGTKGLNTITEAHIAAAVKGSVALGILLFTYSRKNNFNAKFFGCNTLSGGFCGVPVREFEIRSYSPVSAVTTIILSSALILLCPGVLSRIPMHSIGALLIVSAWQNAPYKYVASTFKSKSIIGILAVIILIAAFTVLDIFSAFVLCIVAAFLLRRAGK